MVKTAHLKVKPWALAALGWILFMAGVLVSEPIMKIILLSAARILP